MRYFCSCGKELVVKKTDTDEDQNQVTLYPCRYCARETVYFQQNLENDFEKNYVNFD
jgi:hypothetical protein